MLFNLIFLLLCSAMLLGLGGMIFAINWGNPIPLVLFNRFLLCVCSRLDVSAAAHPRISARIGGSWKYSRNVRSAWLVGSAFPPDQLPRLSSRSTDRAPSKTIGMRDAVRGVIVRLWQCSVASGFSQNGFAWWCADAALSRIAAMAFKEEPGMRTAWLIAAHDLRLFLRAKSSWVWLLLVPLIFIGFMGYAFKKGKDPEKCTSERSH